jgi:transposase-like protein
VCNFNFSVTANTLFHATRLPLQKWFLAVGLMMAREEPTVRELAAILDVNKDTANHVSVKIRKAYFAELNLLLAVSTAVLKGNHERKDT